MKTSRALLATAALAVPVLLSASPASAAPPSNDLIAGAVPVAPGFSATVDTTEATTDAEDAAVNQNCGAPATDASVWYSYTPRSDETIIVDVSNSTYSAGVIVASGAPGNLSLVSCGPGSVAASLTAGTPYFILAFDDQWDGGGNGGTLNLSVTLGPPAPKVDVIVDRVGLVNKRGSVSLRGVYICSDADVVSINGELTQGESNGGFSFSISGRCDGKLHSWAAGVVGPNAKFTVGRSASMTFSFACGRFECADTYREQTVRLRAR